MATVTCHTEGCSNGGIGIELETTFTDEVRGLVSVDSVCCGVCGQTITDVQT